MFQFHNCCGKNIQLSNNNLVATRTQSFANALVFSQRPLEENEVFLIEILDDKKGWAGFLRCGITFHNPSKIDIPQYLLPDMYQLGKSYVFHIKPSSAEPFRDVLNGKTFEKKCDTLHHEHANSQILCKNWPNHLEPFDTGSRIGMLITPERQLFFFINGEKFGPCASMIPRNVNVFAAFDLYGRTRSVKIVNCCVPSLHTMSRQAVTEHYPKEFIRCTNIPRNLKQEILSML